jgi:hypothetical protein
MNCPICKRHFGDIENHFRVDHPTEYRALQAKHQEDGAGDFVLSAAIGLATNSAILGGLLGGDLLGGGGLDD